MTDKIKNLASAVKNGIVTIEDALEIAHMTGASEEALKQAEFREKLRA